MVVNDFEQRELKPKKVQVKVRATDDEYATLGLASKAGPTSREPRGSVQRSVESEVRFSRARDLDDVFGTDWYLRYDGRVVFCVRPPIVVRCIKTKSVSRKRTWSSSMGRYTDWQIKRLDHFVDVEVTLNVVQELWDSYP